MFNVQVFKSIKVTCSLSLTSKYSLQGALFKVDVLCIVLYPGRKMFAVFVLGRNGAAVAAAQIFFPYTVVIIINRWQYQVFIEHEIEIFAVHNPHQDSPPLAPKSYL